MSENESQVIYVVSFAPAYDGGSCGGCEWRRTRKEAVEAMVALGAADEEDGADYRLTTLGLPSAMTDEEITDFLGSAHGVEIVDPPDPRVDLDEALVAWRECA